MAFLELERVTRESLQFLNVEMIRHSLERAYASPRVRFAVASLLLLFDSSPSRIGKYGCFYSHKRRSP